MIVMITAITASLNASTRPVPSSIAPLEGLRWLTVVHHKSALTRPDEVADLFKDGRRWLVRVVRLTIQRGSADAHQEIPAVPQRYDQQHHDDRNQPAEGRIVGAPTEECARDDHPHVAESAQPEAQDELVRPQRSRSASACRDETRR